MIKKKHLNLLVLLAFIFSLSSCEFKEVEYKGVKNVQIEQASLKGVKVKITAEVNNPNTFNIRLVKGKFNVKSDDFDFGTFNLSEKTVIPAESSGDVDIFVDTKFKSLFSGSVMGLLSKLKSNNMPVTIDGYITAKAYLFSKRIKFNKTENISL